MCKRYLNGTRPVRRLIYITLLATFYSILITVHALASDEPGAATTRPDTENQIRTKRNSLVPNPDLSPADVVRIQLDALGNNNDPHNDAGIEITFRFASPANKQSTGPLNRFIQLVHNPVYKPMLDHQTARFGDLVVEDGQAYLPVFLTASDGKRVGYVFVLSRQRGGAYDQCWMTDAVLQIKATQA